MSSFKISFINLLSIFILSACASKPSLMPTPNIYNGHDRFSENQIPLSQRKTEMDVIYVTDRLPVIDNDQYYGADRSSSMAYGLATVGFNNNSIDWNNLLTSSNQIIRDQRLTYKMANIIEHGRFPATPYPFTKTNSGIKINPEISLKHQQNIDGLQNLIKQKLNQSNTKDVILFIHGFNNTFDYATFTTAGLWHFLQRQGVPLVYSWPAAKGGLTGYFTDRESGEFTIFHLKETLRILFNTPEIENIHIIAHSRGNDVATTALRELIIEQRAAGNNPKEKFKISNLIMAAPDLDFGVIQQRLMTEKFGLAFDQITIYTSDNDNALGLSQWLMKGLRFGRIGSQDIGLNEKNIFSAVGNVNLIKVPKSKSFTGHDYFHSNPAVSSDLIRLIQNKSKPGSSDRPLILIENNFWSLPSDYLSTKTQQ